MVTTKGAVTPAACKRRSSARSRCQAQLFAVGELASMRPINEACMTDSNGVCFFAHVAAALAGAERPWTSDLGRRERTRGRAL